MPDKQNTQMFKHEESSLNDTHDGISNIANLDGQNRNKKDLFGFKKVKGFKQKTLRMERKDSSKSHLQDEIVFSNLKILPKDI